MKKLLAISLIGIFMLVGFNACKKYEDGPTLSLRSKKARVVGEWTISKAENQGIDVSKQYAGFTLSFKDNDTYTAVFSGKSEPGTWAFDGEKDNIILTPTGSSTTETLKIIRLTNSELTFEMTALTQVTRFYFVTK
jgi:hypothetical protein